ncbi:hypothetical protein DENSPDRAFT_175794 [Dentipellis sp. KUC8613]|nr:hypothetical protein DENSPDRAFT_175794 [Dentipellis sp. KUC8613]
MPSLAVAPSSRASGVLAHCHHAPLSHASRRRRALYVFIHHASRHVPIAPRRFPVATRPVPLPLPAVAPLSVALGRHCVWRALCHRHPPSGHRMPRATTAICLTPPLRASRRRHAPCATHCHRRAPRVAPCPLTHRASISHSNPASPSHRLQHHLMARGPLRPLRTNPMVASRRRPPRHALPPHHNALPHHRHAP